VSVEGREPDVIVDFVFDDGLLYATVANIGDRPALKVSCHFEPAFHGLGGSVEISRSAAYFARKEPTKLEVTVTYRDESGTRREATIRHDLGIYRDLAYVPPERHHDDFAD